MLILTSSIKSSHCFIQAKCARCHVAKLKYNEERFFSLYHTNDNSLKNKVTSNTQISRKQIGWESMSIDIFLKEITYGFHFKPCLDVH